MTATPEKIPFEQWDAPEGEWTLPGRCPVRTNRTLLLEAATRFLFPTVLVFSVYLLIVGHYAPGGGFSGGLIAGLAFVLRYIAGGGSEGAEIGSRLKLRPPALMGGGLLLAMVSAFAPVAFGAPVLASAKVSFLGIEVVSSLLLDVGVYLLIVGVVLDLLRSLGSGIERDAEDAAGDAPGRTP
jgi:multicomponent Na+:H+ antiporter subunit B